MWHMQEARVVLKDFGVNPISGLSDREAGSRIDEYGINKLAEKKRKSPFQLFFLQLNNMLIYILLAISPHCYCEHLEIVCPGLLHEN